MARRRSTGADAGDELADIEEWYRARLTAPAVHPVTDWPPVYIGPTWLMDGDRWLLPDLTLGWTALAWCGRWLKHNTTGIPWTFTDEQARFLLHWYSVNDTTGEFHFRDAVLQRLKGWGKDPLVACVSAFEMLGPARVADIDAGRIVGQDVPEAWIQTAAVSLEQTKNTMKLFPGLFTAEARARWRIEPLKRTVHAMGNERLIEAVTSSPDTLEGGRPTFLPLNETQHWDSSNAGHDMAAVVERNVTKSSGGAARTLRITNAFEPGMDSVAERDREAYEHVQAGRAVDTGLLYDSVEAPPDAPLTLEAAPAVVESIRGDSVWLDTRRIVQSIADPRNPPSRSRRFWYNQITATEDARFDPNLVKLASVDAHLDPGDEIVMFGDGSKSDDATGIIAVRIRDGLAQLLHVQQPKAGEIVDREAVDLAVTQAFETYKPVAFWFDPSHATDDDAEGDNRFWYPLCDEWMARYGRKLKHWATKTGAHRHAIVWDMASPARQAEFVPAVEQLDADLISGTFKYAKSAWLQQHLINARRNPGRFGVSMRKASRESRHKIDLAVCAAGARMLWRAVHLARVAKGQGAPGKGRVLALD